MANAGSVGILEHMDNPDVTIIADATAAGVTWVSDSPGSATDFAKAVAAGKGLHYAGALTAVDNELLEFCGNSLMFTAQEGHAQIEILVQYSVISDVAFNFGFNDTVEDGNLPMDLSGTTLAATATAWAGIVKDFDATFDELHVAWVNGGTVGQTDSAGKVDGEKVRMEGMSLTAAQWLYMKVEMQDRGSGLGARMTFTAIDHTGKSIEKVFNTSITRSTPLCFHYAVENRDATVRNLFIRMPNWKQTIPDM